MKKRVVFALLMGIVSTGLISCILLAVNTSISGGRFVQAWIKSWAYAYVVVIPVILIIGPQVEKIVNKIVKE